MGGRETENQIWNIAGKATPSKALAWTLLSALLLSSPLRSVAHEPNLPEADRLAVSAGSIAAGSEDASGSEKIEAYCAMVSDYAQHALEEGQTSYRQLLERFYPASSLTDNMYEAKGQWRMRWAEQFVFVSDYDSVAEPVAVKRLRPTKNSELGSTLVACYEARRHVVRVSRVASDSAVLHEAGHALQRVALLERKSAKESFVSASYRGVGRDEPPAGRSAYLERVGRRLEYLSSQDEFEVRLQDLNRFFAVIGSQGPIMNPLDAVSALYRLGMPLSYEEVAESLVGTSWSLSEGDFEELVSGADRVGSVARAAFEDASELLLMRTLVHEWDRSLWPQCLRKILFEAPGHL